MSKERCNTSGRGKQRPDLGPPLSYSSYQFLKSEACFGAVYEAKQGSGLPEVEVRNRQGITG